MQQLRGRVVVVTGASAGIGEATAVAFAQRGARVVLAARRLDRLEELARRIESAGGHALAMKVDVTDHEQLERLPGIVKEAYGPTDVLVNNAGIPGGGGFEDLTYEQIERIVRVNLLAVIDGTRAFLPGMRRRGHGHIVNVASLAGRFAAPGASVYSATKHGVVAFGESLGLTSGPVLVTTVLPGFVPTERFSGRGPRPLRVSVEQVAGAIIRAVRDGRAGEVCVPRWVGPFEMVRIVLPGVYRAALAAGARRMARD
jgi:NADP-dependent 3-hydroxy acid dehydrogenase YdfG